MSQAEKPDFYDSFDILWDAGKYEDAIRLYEFVGRPFWLAEKIGVYYEHTHRPDRAMHEYEHLINAYFGMGRDFLPFPGGPVELYKVGKWFMKTDPGKAEKYLRLYVQSDEKNSGEIRKTIFRTEAIQLLEELVRNKPVSIPDAMALALRAETRIGLWWYCLKTDRLLFSAKAKSHVHIDEFEGLPDMPRGWIRGFIFVKDVNSYVLIHREDFLGKAVPAQLISGLCKKAQEAAGLEIQGVVDEQGEMF